MAERLDYTIVKQVLNEILQKQGCVQFHLSGPTRVAPIRLPEDPETRMEVLSILPDHPYGNVFPWVCLNIDSAQNVSLQGMDHVILAHYESRTGCAQWWRNVANTIRSNADSTIYHEGGYWVVRNISLQIA